MDEKNVKRVEAAATAETAGSAESQEEKKYTDADVDRIIASKLAREREKFSKQQEAEQQESDFERRERELTIRELKADARDALEAKGLPTCLSKVLKYDSKEAYEESMAAIEEVAGEMERHFEIKRATGVTPKAMPQNNSGNSIRNAFKL